MVVAALLLSLLAPQADARVRRLVGELDGLPADFTSEAFLKRPAIQELIALQEEGAPALEEALRTSPGWSVRASAAYVLGEIRHSAALLERFADNHSVVRSFVLEALLKNNYNGTYVQEDGKTVFKAFDFNHPGIPEPVVETARERAVLDEPHASVRLSRLVAALGRRTPTETERSSFTEPPNYAEEKIRRADEAERAVAIFSALPESGARGAIELLIATFGQNADPLVRADALDALTAWSGRVGEVYPREQAVALKNRLEALALQGLRDASVELRYRAMGLLGSVGDIAVAKAALEERAAVDPHPALRLMARTAASRLQLPSPKPVPLPPREQPAADPAAAPSKGAPPPVNRTLLPVASGVIVLAILALLLRRVVRGRSS